MTSRKCARLDAYGSLNVGFLLLLLCLVPSCQKRSNQQPVTTPTPTEPPELVFATWEEYIAPELLDRFQADTGITVSLMEFGSSEQMESILQEELDSFDVIVVDHSTLPTCIDLNFVAPLKSSWIPNRTKVTPLLKEGLAGKKWDHCIPYFSGTTVIAYNKQKFSKPPDSWLDFWKVANRGQVGLFEDQWDFLALAQVRNTGRYYLASDIEVAHDLQDFEALMENCGDITEFDDLLEKIGSGELWLGNAYSGDVQYYQKDYPDLAAVWPREGAMRWVDCLVISRRAKHNQNAHRFMNFLLEPEIAAINASVLGFPPVVEEAREWMDKDFLSDPLLFPPPATEAAIPLYPELTPEFRALLNQYNEVVSKRLLTLSQKGRVAPD